MSHTPLRRDEEEQADPLAKLYNVHAEQALLGALFFSNRSYEAVVDIVGRDDFGHALHGRIFAAIGTLIEQGIQAAPPTIKDFFAADEALAAAGGEKYLFQLAQCAVTILNARDYALTIADLALRREIILAARDMEADASECSADRSADMVLDDSEEWLFQIGERRRRIRAGLAPVGDSVDKVIAEIEAAYKGGGRATLGTGLTDLDNLIGGMAAGDLYIVAGRPSMGKTALAATIARELAERGKKIAFFSLEMTREQLTSRWLAGMTGISIEKQRKGEVGGSNDWTKLIESGKAVKRLPIMVDDQPRLSVAQMRQRARRLKRRHGLDLVIVDHLHLIRLGGKQESRRVEVGEAADMLKALAKELNVPVLLLAQLNRAVEGREDKRPALFDLKESGDIEAAADVVMFLYREEYYLVRAEPHCKPDEDGEEFRKRQGRWIDRVEETRGLAEVAVAKNRHGRTGNVQIRFDAVSQKFENLYRRRP
jgi:replicative DNA helicase